MVDEYALEAMFRSVEVPLKRTSTAVIRPQSLRISAESLEVIVVDPPKPEAVPNIIGDALDVIGKAIGLADKIWGGGGGGGGGTKCESKISQTVDKDGTITTTIETKCAPA